MTPEEQHKEKHGLPKQDLLQSSTGSGDLTDSTSDQERLKNDSVALNMPDIQDGPGQEEIATPVTTAWPDELPDVFDNAETRLVGNALPDDQEDDVAFLMGTDADVTVDDLLLLGDPDKDQDGLEDEQIRNEGLDDTDFDGDLLNEAIVDNDSTGEDLTVPGSDLDDADEAIGAEDEENNYYSLGSDTNDDVVEGTP